MPPASDMWKAWKSSFTEWLDSHYKLSWEMSSTEWTEGVINPYLLFIVREKLGMWIRFAQEGSTGAIVFDTDSASEVAHVEHANDRGEVIDRMPALLKSGPGLKCVITYGEPKGGEPEENRRENRELMTAWNDTAIKPIMLKILAREPAQTWLFIIGLEYDFRTESDWMALLYTTEGGKAVMSELE